MKPRYPPAQQQQDRPDEGEHHGDHRDHPASETANPFLSGNFAPVHDEVTRHDLVTHGRLPEALTGRYLRTGPNPLAEVTGPHHWFTGDGMIHGIELAGWAGRGLPQPLGAHRRHRRRPR